MNSILRNFGMMMAGILSLFFGLLLPFLSNKPSSLYIWVASAFFFILACVQPLWLRPIYALWMKIGHVLGWINTRILLGIIFFCLITPIGIIMRLGRHDPMQRGYHSNVNTYRKNIPSRSIQHMEKPY